MEGGKEGEKEKEMREGEEAVMTWPNRRYEGS